MAKRCDNCVSGVSEDPRENRVVTPQKNTVAERGDDRVFGVSEDPRENRVVTLLNDWEMKKFGIPSG